MAPTLPAPPPNTEALRQATALVAQLKTPTAAMFAAMKVLKL